MKLTLGKYERLKSRKLIEKLFAGGKAIKKYPLRMIFLQTQHPSTFPVQVGFVVPKRNFNRAVDRNRIKRLLREAYRLQKAMVYENVQAPYVCMISYLAKEELTFDEIYTNMTTLLHQFIKETTLKNEEKIS